MLLASRRTLPNFPCTPDGAVRRVCLDKIDPGAGAAAVGDGAEGDGLSFLPNDVGAALSLFQPVSSTFCATTVPGLDLSPSLCCIAPPPPICRLASAIGPKFARRAPVGSTVWWLRLRQGYRPQALMPRRDATSIDSRGCPATVPIPVLPNPAFHCARGHGASPRDSLIEAQHQRILGYFSGLEQGQPQFWVEQLEKNNQFYLKMKDLAKKASFQPYSASIS